MTWNERKFVNDVLAQNVKDVLAQNVTMLCLTSLRPLLPRLRLEQLIQLMETGVVGDEIDVISAQQDGIGWGIMS